MLGEQAGWGVGSGAHRGMGGQAASAEEWEQAASKGVIVEMWGLVMSAGLGQQVGSMGAIWGQVWSMGGC